MPRSGEPVRVPNLLHGVRRGKPDDKHPDQPAATPGRLAANLFRHPRALPKELKFRPHTPGMMFFGAVDAPVHEDEPSRERPGALRLWAEADPKKFVGHCDDRHVFTVAGTRAGKGRAVIVPNLFLWETSVLAIDVKGELARLTAVHRRDKKNQRVAVLDPFGTTKRPAVGEEPVPEELRRGFNPLAGIAAPTEENKAEGRLVELSGLIAEGLVTSDPGGRDVHWSESAKAFLAGLVAHVATHKGVADADRHLATVRALASEATGGGPQTERTRCDLEEAMRGSEAGDGFVRRAAADLFDKPDAERGSVLSTLKRNLAFLDLPEIKTSVSDPDGIDLATLKTKATTIYLCLPARLMGTCGRWFRLIVTLAMQAMETERFSPASPGPVLMVLDEMAVLGHMQQLIDAAGQMAGHGLKLWFVFQDVTQAKALYGERWETFTANAGMIQAFGCADEATTAWIARKCGQTSVRSVLVDEQNRQVADRPQTVEMLPAHEAAQLLAREDEYLRQLLIPGDQIPAICQKVFHDKEPARSFMRG